jgi:hypothetical protein
MKASNIAGNADKIGETPYTNKTSKDFLRNIHGAIKEVESTKDI